MYCWKKIKFICTSKWNLFVLKICVYCFYSAIKFFFPTTTELYWKNRSRRSKHFQVCPLLHLYLFRNLFLPSTREALLSPWLNHTEIYLTHFITPHKSQDFWINSIILQSNIYFFLSFWVPINFQRHFFQVKINVFKHIYLSSMCSSSFVKIFMPQLLGIWDIQFYPCPYVHQCPIIKANFPNHLIFIHRVSDYKRKAKFDFRPLVFHSGVMLLFTFFHFSWRWH